MYSPQVTVSASTGRCCFLTPWFEEVTLVQPCQFLAYLVYFLHTGIELLHAKKSDLSLVRLTKPCKLWSVPQSLRTVSQRISFTKSLNSWKFSLVKFRSLSLLFVRIMLLKVTISNMARSMRFNYQIFAICFWVHSHCTSLLLVHNTDLNLCIKTGRVWQITSSSALQIPCTQLFHMKIPSL